jgi:hypothetical protein
MLAELRLTPCDLARGDRPTTFVDVVSSGSTFTTLFRLLRDWIDEERAPWKVIRRRMRFVGVTIQGPTTPNTWRWQQHADWTRDLPARSVRNVSMDVAAWAYLGNHQVKLHRTFRPQDWLAETEEPNHDEAVRAALTEALAVVEHGRTPEARRTLTRTMMKDPARAEPWLRSLATQLVVG